MAATPTELLAEDVGSLRESDRQLTESIKTLTASVNDLRTDFAALKAVSEREFGDSNGFRKWVLGLLVTFVLGSGGVIWGSAVLSNEVKHQGERLDKLESKIDQVIQRLDQVVPKSK